MKKIIITILVGLFSCQMPVVNKDKDKNTTTTKVETKPDFSGKDCIPYDLGVNLQEKFLHYPSYIYDYIEKAKIKKENPYLGKIEIIINPGVLPYGPDGKDIIVNQENKLKIEESEKSFQEGMNGIKINDKDTFYFDEAYFIALFNNSCEYEFFKTKVVFLSDSYKMEDKIERKSFFSSNIDISKEKIEIEKIEPLLHEYNKYFINNLTKIEFSSTNSLKVFLLFIKLSLQEPVFYRDLEISIYINVTKPSTN
ncbi:MAG: hypothetical protein AABZ74_09135 [Cyanobacteriota bacterium]